MLLADLTASLQSQYAQIQSQIEALQEQQRQIQAQLQRVGSVESKMESAASLISEAIFEILEVCPEEIERYKATINSLFVRPVAQLPESASDADVNPVLDPHPQPGTDPEGVAIDVEVVAESLALNGHLNGNKENNIGSQPPILNGNGLNSKQLNELSIQQIRKLASAKGIQSKGRKRGDIAQDLEGLVSHEDLN